MKIAREWSLSTGNEPFMVAVQLRPSDLRSLRARRDGIRVRLDRGEPNQRRADRLRSESDALTYLLDQLTPRAK